MNKTFAAVLVGLAAAAGCSSDGPSDEASTVTVERTTTVEVTVGGDALPEEPGSAEDPDDAEGALDLRSVSAVRTGDLLAVSLTTYERWRDDLLAGPRLDLAGPNRLTVLYDVDLDGRRDYTGKIIFAEGALSVVIAGEGQAFEPVPVERPDDATAQFIHPVDVFFVVAGQEGVDSDADIQVAFESAVAGGKDRAPDEGWVLVAFAP